jgi:hypothetical protein
MDEVNYWQSNIRCEKLARLSHKSQNHHLERGKQIQREKRRKKKKREK